MRCGAVLFVRLSMGDDCRVGSQETVEKAEDKNWSV